MPDLSAAMTSAYHSHQRVDGLTHVLYRYPARFSPQFVRAAVEEFTSADGVVLDPFLGGGTSAIESLAHGRRFVGFDINPLSLVLTRAKTTPVSARDKEVLRTWARSSGQSAFGGTEPRDGRLRNAPEGLVHALAPYVRAASELPVSRQRDAARAVLLHVGQWAIDGRTQPVEPEQAAAEVPATTELLISGLADFAAEARVHGLRPFEVARRRSLFCGATQALGASRQTNRLVRRASLVLTSPPYPGVHVLYHRWQVNGSLETPMPYWLTQSMDGQGYKHYTMGGRSGIAEDAYFRQIQAAWSAIRRLIRPGAMVVQLVSFSAPDRHLPRYLEAMAKAGYAHRPDLEPGDWRQVPHRRWYTNVDRRRDCALEALVIHQAPTCDVI